MVIRPGGYNTGAQEYLETGNKAGRELHRDELDHRMIIEGDLDRTRSIYESIPDHGQDRYLTFTLSFREDQLNEQVLRDITQEFKQFLMHAYKPDEFNFYAEAHLPKIKYVPDKKTGEMIERKPHIHIIVPRINLLSGNEANPVDVYMNHVKFYEAFQEYVNQKYELASPRDHIRVDIADAASVLSRYKADDFYGKNREFKQGLVKQVIERGVTDRKGFYALVGESGETRIRNEGKENEYIAVKLEGDAKFTNLKDTIFNDDFIVRRELKMPPLDEKLIHDRLQSWPQRAREIKYVNKATPKFRQAYSEASPEDRVRLLADREAKFYQTYGDNYDRLHPGKRPRDHQRSADEAQGRSPPGVADGLQDLSRSDVADHGQAGPTRLSDGAVLLPNDAHVHLGQHQPGGDPGLRSPVPGGRGGRGSTGGSGRRQPTAAVPATAAGTRKAGKPGRAPRAGAGPRTRITDNPLPPHARNPRRMASMADIQARSRRLFDPLKPPIADGPAIQLDRDKLFIPEPRGPGDPAKASGTRKKARPRNKRSPGTATRSKASNAPKRSTDHSLPPFARNPHRIPTVADIQRHGQRLFEPSRRRTEPLEIKLPSIKALTASRSASTVAAYFSRQAEQQQLLPAQRHALRRLNSQYFALRRSVFSDQRLTRQDKSQLVSVLTFERLKATEQIRYPSSSKEVHLMGSADIRKLIEDDNEEPHFSISGPRGATPTGVRDRVRNILDRVSKQLDPNVSQERARELAAKDIYTRKAKFSQNVHYLDKLTDKTLFVDTGTSIAMRRSGITQSGVAVALQLAKERFGSTLTINGTADFKHLVVEAAAKNGLDVHFTDKNMNTSLALRRAELEIEKEGQAISPAVAEMTAAGATAESPEQAVAEKPDSQGVDTEVPIIVLNPEQLSRFVDSRSREPRELTDRLGLTPLIEAMYGEGKTADEISKSIGSALNESGVILQERVTFINKVADTLGVPSRGPNGAGSEAFAHWQQQRGQPSQAHGYDLSADSPSELVRREVAWRNGDLRVSDQDVRGSDTIMQMRGEDHAVWILGASDATPEGTAMLKAYMENDSYREAFKATIEKLYVQYQHVPDTITTLDAATAAAVEIVNDVENRKAGRAQAAPETPTTATAAPRADRKVIEGQLLAHGAAPYKHEAENQASYFVTLKTDAGERTIWGVALAEAMEHAGVEPGEQLRLEDLGTQPVVVQEVAEDGTVTEKTTHRRQWAAEPTAPERQEAAPVAPTTATSAPMTTDDDEPGMSQD
jgi:hypothetical protein